MLAQRALQAGAAALPSRVAAALIVDGIVAPNCFKRPLP